MVNDVVVATETRRPFCIVIVLDIHFLCEDTHGRAAVLKQHIWRVKTSNEVSIASAEAKVVVRWDIKQPEVRATSPDSCGANSACSPRKKKRNKDEARPLITDTSVLLAEDTCTDILLKD